MNATRTATVAAIAAGLVTTACTSGRTPATVVTVAPAAPATTPPAETVEEVPFVLDLGDELVEDEPVDDTDAVEIDADDPAGTVVQIAVRYLNALRAGRWYGAVDDMAFLDRVFLDPDDAPAIGREVLRNARGNRTTLPRCTSGERFAEKAVVVRCGRVDVVVHVATRPGFRGVSVSDFHVDDDHLARPHTHAYSTRV
ncbi:MAG TPA: hypothetical protein VNA14_04590 [Mycobacteriales bacterium]|nr:hypothetical protein [Mycobacteriales bacterium]